MKVYFLSGIAADSRLFKYIKLPIGYDAVFLDWIKPKRDESIDEYSKRLMENISAEEKFVIVGLSMGGIVATEIANIYKPIATIILGSVSTSDQLPPYYKWLNRLKVNKMIPGNFYKWAAALKHRFSNENKEDKDIIIKMIRQADPDFIYWGINAVPKWNNLVKPNPLFHIHGTRDEVFPINFTRPTHVIKKGGHLLAISHPEEINSILKEILKK
ncbi:MAG TPA: alpha/beta hydrolase [Flavisolibacter sp.]|nr:alpha/beta hydrolase [Flavisolibacter sp.]